MISINRINQVVVNNPKTAFWTMTTLLGAGGVSILVNKYKNKFRVKSDAELHSIKTDKDTESDVIKTAIKTACKMMENATDMAPEIKKMKEQMEKLQEQMKNNGGNNSSNPNPQSSSNAAQQWQSSSYEDMMRRTAVKCAPIVPGLVEKGLVNVCLGGAGVGKSLVMRQIARVAATGERCEFMPADSEPSAKMGVLFYRMEEFPGEDERKYGAGRIFSDAGIQWRTKSDLRVFNLQGLLDDLELFAKQATEDTLICIDPITKLKDYNHEKFIAGAERIQSIAPKGVVLTFLISAHIDEVKDWNIVTSENIKGGDKLIQQAGSVFVVRKERRGNGYRHFQVLKEPKGYAPKDSVVVCKIVETVIDDDNKNTNMVFVDEKIEAQARPLRPKAIDNKDEDMPKSQEQEWLDQALAIEKMLKDGVKKTDIATKLNISRPTIYDRLKYLEEWRENQEPQD